MQANLEQSAKLPFGTDAWSVVGLGKDGVVIGKASQRGALDCKDFTTQQDTTQGDPNRLDADHDGTGCENLGLPPANQPAIANIEP